MSMTRYEPWGAMNQLQNEIDRLFNHRLGRMRDSDESVTDWSPAVDIAETDDKFVLRADVPGIDPGKIEVSMADGTLTLRGERETIKTDEQKGYRRVERVSGRFYRRFTLPDTADAEGIEARSANGVLEVTIPKHPRVQPRRIEISTD